MLLRCHVLADAGLLYFAPGRNLPTLFLVTHAGAGAVGQKLQGEDDRIMRMLEQNAHLPCTPQAAWRLAVREAQLRGGRLPPYPALVLPRPQTMLRRADAAHAREPAMVNA